jgi:hypothetical protein
MQKRPPPTQGLRRLETFALASSQKRRGRCPWERPGRAYARLFLVLPDTFPKGPTEEISNLSPYTPQKSGAVVE